MGNREGTINSATLFGCHPGQIQTTTDLMGQQKSAGEQRAIGEPTADTAVNKDRLAHRHCCDPLASTGKLPPSSPPALNQTQQHRTRTEMEDKSRNWSSNNGQKYVWRQCFIIRVT